MRSEFFLKLLKDRRVLAIAAAVIVVLGVAIFFLVQYATRNPFADTGAAQSFAATSTAGFLSYENQQYHFSLLYPPNLQVHTYGGAGSALTVAFQDPTTNEGFQVFVVPYDESQITQARFKEDEPSGVMQDPTDVIVGGVRATMFYSTNTTMGDAREVWFLNNGLLYEVTTYKELDTWLAGIMQTWKFE